MRRVAKKKPALRQTAAHTTHAEPTQKLSYVKTASDKQGVVKILVVDDDRRIRESLTRALTLAGYTVFTAKDGAQGVLIFEQEKPDIVLLDVRLPDIDGFEVLRRLQMLDSTAEVLFITGHGDMNLVIDAMRAGVSDFLPKPLQVEQLLSSIAQAEARRKKKQQWPLAQSIKVASSHKAIEVKAFGNLWLRLRSQVILQRDWPSHKARDVFKILLIHHRKLVRTEEFYEWLWSETRRESAEIGLYTAISHIRRMFEPELTSAKQSRFVLCHSGGYELCLGESDTDYAYDVERFETLVAESRRANSLEPLRAAVELYTDDFLKDDVVLSVVQDERERLHEMYLSALITLGRDALRAHRWEEALHYGQKIVKADTLHEAGYEIQIQAYLSQGYAAKAARLLEMCRATYLEELGVPEPPRIARLLQNGEAHKKK
ncbi:MAG: response regulator [Chloroherpetonaceae bacterium]|nr:response regulator [Chloroherpetonaceae bacterium]